MRAPSLQQFRLSELRQWHVVEGTCRRCSRRRVIAHQSLLRTAGGGVSLRDVARRLRCTECGERGGHVLTVRAMPRD